MPFAPRRSPDSATRRNALGGLDAGALSRGLSSVILGVLLKVFGFVAFDAVLEFRSCQHVAQLGWHIKVNKGADQDAREVIVSYDLHAGGLESYI